jgi:hypothetical protein
LNITFKKLILEALKDRLKDPEAAAEALDVELADYDAVYWTTTDVEEMAEMGGFKISRDTARDILHDTIGDHDTDYGITWAAFRYELENGNEGGSYPKVDDDEEKSDDNDEGTDGEDHDEVD